MDLFLSAEESESFLNEELQRAVPGTAPVVMADGLLGVEFARAEHGNLLLAFARQCLPDAIALKAPSISAWAGLLFDAIVTRVPEQSPWHLHIDAYYGAGDAGQNRCELIRERLIENLQKKRRHLLRALVKTPQPFAPPHSLVQLLLTGPEEGFLSIALSPQPYAGRAVLSPFPKGAVPIADDKAAPSRAFTKLVEAELRMGRRISAGESCVDLGASPGSWSYVALQRTAQVTAVDRSPLREDLMRNPRLTFEQGDAFKFHPAALVDWLLCDVIAAPQRSIDLVLEWVRERRARQFVVTIKFKGREEYSVLDTLKKELPPLCTDVYLSRLCANKNEACVFGEVK